MWEKSRGLNTFRRIVSVRSFSQAVHFKHRFNQKDQGCFPMPHKEGHVLVEGYKKKAHIENPFEQDEVINYTLDGLSIHLVNTKIQASFLTQLPERQETAHGFINGVFKTVAEDGSTIL